MIQLKSRVPEFARDGVGESPIQVRRERRVGGGLPTELVKLQGERQVIRAEGKFRVEMPAAKILDDAEVAILSVFQLLNVEHFKSSIT